MQSKSKVRERFTIKLADQEDFHKELYNLRYASARNVVERTFGVFKARFAILSGKGGDGFSILFDTGQTEKALTVLYNLIDAHGGDGANPSKEAIELERTPYGWA